MCPTELANAGANTTHSGPAILAVSSAPVAAARMTFGWFEATDSRSVSAMRPGDESFTLLLHEGHEVHEVHEVYGVGYGRFVVN